MTSGPTIDVSIDYPLWNELDFDAEKIANDILPLAYKAAIKPDILKSRKAEVSLLLTGDDHIHELNREYRGKDKPTNVLSFASLDGDDGASFPQGPEIHIGDIVIAYDTVAREAVDLAIPFRNHYIHLLIHGMLHLLGYDHMEESEAESMESLEIQILNGLGIENPYSHGDFVL